MQTYATTLIEIGDGFPGSPGFTDYLDDLGNFQGPKDPVIGLNLAWGGWMSLTPGTDRIGFGCFVPDLTRLSNPPCGEAHPIPF